MGEKTFNLTWNNHLANLSGLFEALYKSGSLTDATLACQGGMLRAHRLVLAACSPYFERVFKEHYTEQPILILKGTRYSSTTRFGKIFKWMPETELCKFIGVRLRKTDFASQVDEIKIYT